MENSEVLVNPYGVYSEFIGERGMKKSRSENVKIMERMKKQMLLLHGRSTGMA
jgi:hypothetical protein